jgi:hypothetical protein
VADESLKEAWYKGRSPWFWTIIPVAILLNIAWDFYDPRALVIDVVLAAVVLVKYFNK